VALAHRRHRAEGRLTAALTVGLRLKGSIGSEFALWTLGRCRVSMAV